MMSLRSKRNWPIAIPVMLVACYALYQGAFEAQAGSKNVATDAILGLLNNGRIQTFIVLPTWLIAVGFAIHRERAPERLVRLGSWRRTIARPMLKSLQIFGFASAVTVVAWLAILALFGGWGGIAEALLACAGEFILLCIVLVVMYLPMSILHSVAGPVIGLVVTPLGLWGWAALSSMGVASGTQLDLGQYMSISTVLFAPSLLLSLLGVLLTLGASAWLIASGKDDTEPSGGFRPPSVDFIIMWSGAGIALLAAFTLDGRSGTSTDGLTSIFFGTGGTVLQYLVGISVVLATGISAVLRFSNDWEQRAQIVVVRYGSLSRWLVACVVRFVTRAAIYLAAVMTAIIVIRAFRFGQVPSSWSDLQSAAHVYILILSTAVVFIAVGLVCVLKFGSGVAGLTGQAALVMLGLIPLGATALNPITAWSMSLWRVADAQTATVAAVAIGVCAILLVIVSAERRTW